MARFAFDQPYQLLFTGVAAIACLTVGFVFGVSRYTGRNPLRPAHFVCQKTLDPHWHQPIWTVLYQNTPTPQPWLRIIKGMEGDNTLDLRCQDVANKLDRLYKNDLQTLTYQQHHATPGRYAICAYTARSTDGSCEVLLILKPETSPKQFLREFTADLQPEASPQLRSTTRIDQATTATYQEAPASGETSATSVDLRQHLVEKPR